MYKLNLKSLTCIDTATDTASDRCRIEIWLDGLHTLTLSRKMSQGFDKWSLNRNFWYHRVGMIRIYVRTQGGHDQPVWQFMISGVEKKMTTHTISGTNPRFYLYQAALSVDKDSSHKPEKDVQEIDIGNTKREYVLGEQRNLVDLRLSPGGPTWEEEYCQGDTGHVNDCGPVAGLNLLHWFNKSPDPDDVFQRMRTNNWDNEIWPALMGGLMLIGAMSPVLATPLAALGRELSEFGTLPKHLHQALQHYTPTDTKLRSATAEGRLTDITNQLRKGRPVLVLYSPKEWGLHWAVITGYYLDSRGKARLRIANGTDLEWNDFWRGWKIHMPDSVRDLFKEVLGIKPFQMVWYQ